MNYNLELIKYLFIRNYEQFIDVLKKNNKLLEKDCKIVYASLCLEPNRLVLSQLSVI